MQWAHLDQSCDQVVLVHVGVQGLLESGTVLALEGQERCEELRQSGMHDHICLERIFGDLSLVISRDVVIFSGQFPGTLGEEVERSLARNPWWVVARHDAGLVS